MRTGLTGLYGFIGIVHLVATERFLPIMPGWVPAPRLVVIGTGLCEIAGALALFVPRLRRIAGIMLALYAVCVFPANIKQAVEGIAVPPIPDTWWYHGPRLALQPVMVWWALSPSTPSIGRSQHEERAILEHLVKINPSE